MTKVVGTVKIGDFSRAFGEEMVKYTNDIEDEIQKMTAKLTKDAAKELKQVSASTFNSTQNKPYNEGWTAKNDSVRHRARWVIHNKNKPGLAHLLEHGHAKVKGGRVAGKSHIKPIEEKLIKDYEENVEAIIKDGGM